MCVIPQKTLTLQRKSINNLMTMKPYEEPTMTVVELHQQTHLMDFSRSGSMAYPPQAPSPKPQA